MNINKQIKKTVKANQIVCVNCLLNMNYITLNYKNIYKFGALLVYQCQ